MADSIMSYAIAAGIFAFLVAVLFGTRTKRIWASRKEVPGKDSKFTHGSCLTRPPLARFGKLILSRSAVPALAQDNVDRLDRACTTVGTKLEASRF